MHSLVLRHGLYIGLVLTTLSTSLPSILCRHHSHVGSRSHTHLLQFIFYLSPHFPNLPPPPTGTSSRSIERSRTTLLVCYRLWDVQSQGTDLFIRPTENCITSQLSSSSGCRFNTKNRNIFRSATRQNFFPELVVCAAAETKISNCHQFHGERSLHSLYQSYDTRWNECHYAFSCTTCYWTVRWFNRHSYVVAIHVRRCGWRVSKF